MALRSGWRRQADGDLELYANGTLVGTFTATGVTWDLDHSFLGNVAGDGTVSLPQLMTIGGVDYAFPAADGSTGTQLQTNGSGVLSWAAAGSLQEFKELAGKMDPREALSRLLDANVYRFHYKPDAALTTGDFDTEYVGIVGEEAPWAMHHEGRVFNPVSAFGHAVAAIQALTAQVKELEGKLAAQGGAA